MANELSTAGVTVGYAFESTSGERPVSGYQRVPGVKSTPDLNPEPSNLEVTELEDTEWKRYILGMKDPGGALALTCNNTVEFQAAWYTLCQLSAIARADSKATWFVIAVPGLTDSFFVSAIPSSLGVIGMDVDAVAEVTAYISPNNIDAWQTAPTDPAVYITPITTQLLTVGNSPIVLTPTLNTVGATILAASSSNTGVATVARTTTTVTITRAGAGECDITVTTDANTGYSAGKTIIKVKST